MPRDESRAELLALAALYELAGDAREGPIKPALWIRAVLAFLYARRTEGGREPYRDFWSTITDTFDSGPGTGYQRASYARTHWNKIVKTMGLEPQSQTFHQAITDLIDRQRRVNDPEWRAIREAAERVSLGKFDREIVSTKGHPHSAGGRVLLSERLADGKLPDGSSW